jgi:transcriptional regulator with XRE-family HTH domain
MSKQGGWPASGFADRLRELREQVGMSQAQLAECVGVHALSISKLERGVHEPLWPLVLAIAEALERPVQDFVAGAGTALGEASKRPPGRPRRADSSPPADPEAIPDRTASERRRGKGK